MVDEEDDEISATRYISSRPWCGLSGKGSPRCKWGRSMPSPFDDPSISTDLDKEEEAHAQEGLEDYVEHYAGRSRGGCSCQQQAGPLCLGDSQTQLMSIS
ncbi:TPA: hypothetical protein ACH3X3_012703 [Trebouxia sp. C0006]